MIVSPKVRYFFSSKNVNDLKIILAKRKFTVAFLLILTFQLWLNLISHIVYSIFDTLEYYLEILVRKLFKVDYHVSEVIVFYLFFVLAFCGFVRLWFLLPRIYQYFYRLYKSYTLQFAKLWQTLALLEKVKLFFIYLLLSSEFIFTLFL